MQRIEFRAMGCQMLALIDNDDEAAASALQHVPEWFADWEAVLSRFRSDSEITLLNADAGFWVPLSETLWSVLQAALEAAQRSAGVVVPTILHALHAVGYTRDFAAGPQMSAAPIRITPAPDWRQIEVEASLRAVRLPEGVQIDLSGIAKGWAADQTVQRLAAYGPTLVDAGGDIAVSGPMASGHPWLIGVDDPFNPGTALGMLSLSAGGVATSGRDYRRWQTAEGWQHHIIDPRSGRPAQSNALTATAVAPSAQAAEVAAKLIFILGDAGLEHVAQWPGHAGMLLRDDGSQSATPGWAGYLYQTS
ncbi:ApbE family lipoprotein [Oscillochloris trichoides DG-6]|uniref:FAD:protein FMN transferase n=1 Tax=Oscillochloris trichoides DG-6 TaxID=765420 RepID=E1IDM4_9CHLR|nr:FAD:protein FMN transferase [Oscillochloris trichoides]EFO80732.1 ApbE family lipoprotein [Oscillochloris trichoides DG-6]